jgi:hypothetical protein
VAFFPAAAMTVGLILSSNAWRTDVAWVKSQIESANAPCLNRAALSGDALANQYDWYTLPLSLIGFEAPCHSHDKVNVRSIVTGPVSNEGLRLRPPACLSVASRTRAYRPK